MVKIQKNISLADYTTFKIGGPAKYFCKVEGSNDLIKAVGFIKDKDLPFFILGGGSNILVSDNGFDGLVIMMNNRKIKIGNNRIIAEAGVRLGDLIRFSIKNSLTGLEWAIGIPGTVGGAVKIDAHAFGSDMLQLVKDIKKQGDIIFSVGIELKKGSRQESKKLVKQYIEKRKNTQPLNCASAGCVFKNPPNNFAGQLIDKSGLKGAKIGRAMISDKHANFIVNLGQAKAKDVVNLIELTKQTIKEKFGIDLEEEIEYLGF